MIDAWGKIPSGILRGNTFELGNYDQCVEIKHESKKIGNIQGQYCLADIILQSNLVPASSNNTSSFTKTDVSANTGMYNYVECIINKIKKCIISRSTFK